MISNGNYYLDDLLKECSLYLPRMNIREICSICWSINKLQLYKYRRGELLTQRCIETLLIHQDLNKIRNNNIKLEYIRHGLELMYNSGQINNELIGKHCNQLPQISMISVDRDANSRIHDKCIDLVIISETIGILVINHGNDMFFLMWHTSYKRILYHKHHKSKNVFFKWFIKYMKYSSNCDKLGFNYQLILLDNDLFNILTRQQDGQGNQVEINPLHIANIVNSIAQCVNCNDLLTQSNLFDIGSAGAADSKEEEDKKSKVMMKLFLIFLKMHYKKI